MQYMHANLFLFYKRDFLNVSCLCSDSAQAMSIHSDHCTAVLRQMFELMPKPISAMNNKMMIKINVLSPGERA